MLENGQTVESRGEEATQARSEKTVVDLTATLVGTDNEHPFIWFDFTTNRKRQGPDAVLRAFRGYLQADGYGGYSGYEGVMLSDDTPILKVACRVHAHRKFRDAMSSDSVRAALAISYIANSYEL